MAAVALLCVLGVALMTGPASAAAPPQSTSTSAESVGPLGPGLGMDEGPKVGGGAGRGHGTGMLVAVGVAGLVVGSVAGATVVARRRVSEGAPVPPASASAGSVEPTPVADQVRDERNRLVRALIDAVDQVSSEAVRSEMLRQLGSVGVDAVLVEAGSAFDPAAQRGVHAETTSDPAAAGTVASTDRPGWVDRGQVIRPPEVVVYRMEDGS